MKKTLLGIICFFACIFSIQAQTLYGTTYHGGNEGGGTISKFTPATNNLTVAKSFESIAAKPKGSLTQASDGKLYGMTSEGGSSGNGVIFSFEPSTTTFTKLKDFDLTTGMKPGGSLMQASDGKLYGMTPLGGSNGAGVIFSFDPSTSTYTKLKDFDGTNGAGPNGSLIQASDGKLYGMAGGGSNSYGVIFSFDPSSSTYAKLKDFDYTNGSNPNGSLIQASDGKLYGMTQDGGSIVDDFGITYGVIFSFDPSSSTYTNMKDFDYTNGAYPNGSLMQASDGKLYGMTQQGGSSFDGVIFSFDPSSSTYAKLKEFDSTNGAYPQGSLMQARDGKLYGMTEGEGSNRDGVIFSFDPSSSTYAKLKDFDGTNGAYPQGSLIQASDGKLYGMTIEGGSGYGVIFSFDFLSSTYTMLRDFASNETGSNVSASLTQTSDGKLYGMTENGGSNGYGAIFSLDPASSTYINVKNFDNTDGGNPRGSLMQASDGKLYGMTQYGGIGNGVIFSFEPSTSTYTKLKDFDYNNGANPWGSLIQASDGKLYGMTTYGRGNRSAGFIFSFDLSSSTYTNVKVFDYTNGGNPTGSLIQASDGKLYGMTPRGGSNRDGVIFSFDPSTSIYTTLKDFKDTDGSYPYGSLMRASDGKLYGMTAGGGSSDRGVIFSFDPSTSTYTKLKDFDGANGAYPEGSLMQASDGKFYGMTAEGGSSNVGVIFSFDPSSSTYTKLQDYDGANGAHPNSAFIEVKDNQNPAPTVSLTIPYNIVKYTAPARIKLNAAATDKDGTITKVQFFNGNTRLHTENVYPYGFLWIDVPVGTYTFTAKAFDDSSNVTTSNSIEVSVVEENVPPVVSIASPVDDTTYTGPATIRLIANAHNLNDKISKVEFYNGTALLRTEHYYPYTYWWSNVQAGTYTITAKAYDDKGLSTTSAPVTVIVTDASVVSRPSSANSKTDVNGALSMVLSPNPARSTLEIYTKGLQLSKPSTISVMSSTGVLVKTIQSSAPNKVVQLDVSSLASGVYTIKVINGGKVAYKQFVKL
jgi:uncharacterized repeat protein (TIGR03803 family)